MLRYLLAILVLIHGLIHLMGFAKAFDYGNITQLTKPITRAAGTFWLITAILFIAVTLLIVLKKEWWWLGIPAVLISQALILNSWQDAKFGTLANFLILAALVANFGMIRFEKKYRSDVRENLRNNSSLSLPLVTGSDLSALPDPVQRYLKYTGVLNRPRVSSMRVVMKGTMVQKGKEDFPFTCEQYNFFGNPARLFYMKGKMFGIEVPGYHRYEKGKATMDIRLFGLIPIQQISGQIMDKTETVTLFNDMCLMAPATLLDNRIRWEPIDRNAAKATFNNGNISISAILYINDKGQLTDFLSNDRTEVSDMKQYPFSTPVGEYRSLHGMNLLKHGDAVWHYPDGKFTYGKFEILDIEYNIASPPFP